MKKANENALLKFTEKFDRELVRLLSSDLKMIKNSKTSFFNKDNNNNNNTLLVA